MRQRNWMLIILCGGVLLGIYSSILWNDRFTVGVLVGMSTSFVMMGYMFAAQDYDDNRDNKRLILENKYRKSIKCSNCGTYHDFEVLKGVCMIEFLKDHKCKNCSCVLTDTIQKESRS